MVFSLVDVIGGMHAMDIHIKILKVVCAYLHVQGKHRCSTFLKSS